ncbi:MAG: hypothetical protein ACRDG7_09775 [Candidatus Limnocylindria bacterium]
MQTGHELVRKSLDELNARARERGIAGVVRVEKIGSGREVITLESYVPAWNDYLELSVALDSTGGDPIVSASLSVMASGELLAQERATSIAAEQVATTIREQVERLEQIMWTVLAKDRAQA